MFMQWKSGLLHSWSLGPVGVLPQKNGGNGSLRHMNLVRWPEGWECIIRLLSAGFLPYFMVYEAYDCRSAIYDVPGQCFMETLRAASDVNVMQRCLPQSISVSQALEISVHNVRKYFSKKRVAAYPSVVPGRHAGMIKESVVCLSWCRWF